MVTFKPALKNHSEKSNNEQSRAGTNDHFTENATFCHKKGAFHFCKNDNTGKRDLPGGQRSPTAPDENEGLLKGCRFQLGKMTIPLFDKKRQVSSEIFQSFKCLNVQS